MNIHGPYLLKPGANVLFTPYELKHWLIARRSNKRAAVYSLGTPFPQLGLKLFSEKKCWVWLMAW